MNVAVAAYDGEGIDVIVCERHFKRVQREVDVRAILVAARRGIALHHLHGVSGHFFAMPSGHLPVAVGDLRNYFAPLFDGFEDQRNVEFPA